MQNMTTSSSLGTRQTLWTIPRLQQIEIYARLASKKFATSGGVVSRRCFCAPLRRSGQLSTLNGATTSEIIAEVLNEEQKRAKPAFLLELLDHQGWGVTTNITRKFATKFATVSLEASWDDDLSGSGRVQSRRLAVMAVHQEWLVGRSSLVGRLVDSLERLRPGYLPRELVERVRASRAASLLTPDTEALDGPSLLLLAALVVPGEQLVEALDRTLAETRAELLAAPTFRGRDDLVPALDRGLVLLRASAVRSLEMAAFRATHLREALEVEVALRGQRQQQPKREEATNGVLGMWFRGPKPSSAAASGSDVSTRAANERLYAGQLAPEAPPWMPPEERAAAAAAPARLSGPRGLPGGRMGLVSFRPLPGAALYSDPGRPGCGSFGSSARLAFSHLDAAMKDLLAKADYEVPAAALTTFARLHRTSLLDLLCTWQWAQLAAAETDPAAVAAGSVYNFYHPRCSHSTNLKPPGPLQVSRRTRIDVAPGPELDALRGLARRRGSELLAVVHPLAREQVVSMGEWEYWREAYRLWDRYAPMPPSCRTASLTLVLTPEQVPYVGLLEAEAAGRAAAASVAVPPSASSAAAADDMDMSSLTSMSSLDFDDAPLAAGLTDSATAATATSSGSTEGDQRQQSGASGSSSSSSKPAGATTPVQTETTVEISVPPEELRRFLLVLLDLLPSHVGKGGVAAAAAAAAGEGGLALAAASAPGEWLPADATTLQIRYCPVGAPWPMAGAAGRAGEPARSGAATSPSSAATASSSSSRLPEEQQPSCYELRWALGSATLTTAPSGPSAAAAYSQVSIPPGPSAPTARSAGAASASNVQWCAPMRLTQAHLMSLVNIFTDVAQKLPDHFGIQPQRLVVPTLSPLERLSSALQGAAGSVVRAAGLLALLAVPLAAALKAGGGDLNAIMAAAPGGGGGRSAGGLAAVAVATVRSVQAPRRDVVAAPRAVPSAEAAETTLPAAPGLSVEELAVLCQRVEAPLEGRMWLEVSGTTGATTVTAGVLPRWLESSGLGLEAAGWPEFQLVVERRSGAVVGCRPVNAAGRALLAELPPAAALRGPAVERAVVGHLAGLTRERIERGKATPGKFDMPYRAARFKQLPLAAAAVSAPATTAPGISSLPAGPAGAAVSELPAATTQQSQSQQQPRPEMVSSQSSSAAATGAATAASQGDAKPSGTSAAPGASSPSLAEAGMSAGDGSLSLPAPRDPADAADAATPSEAWPSGSIMRESPSPSPASASGAPVVVLKLELRPSLDPAQHAVQGKAGKQREYAQADVVVRPWYDSDSLLCWLEGGVQLPSLAAEMGSGLLAREEDERALFLQAYELLKGRAAVATGEGPYGVERRRDPTAAAAERPAGQGAAPDAQSAGGGGGPILKPQQLSEQQLQEALQHLLVSLGIPESNVRVASSSSSAGTGAAPPPAAAAAGGGGGPGTATGRR